MVETYRCPNPSCGRPSRWGCDPLGRTFRCGRCGTKLIATLCAPSSNSRVFDRAPQDSEPELQRRTLGVAIPLSPVAAFVPVQTVDQTVDLQDTATTTAPASLKSSRWLSWWRAASAAAFLGIAAIAGGILLDFRLQMPSPRAAAPVGSRDRHALATPRPARSVVNN